MLLGRSPRAIMEGAVARRAEQGEPAAPVVPEGLPSDLLLRRPDVVQAEQLLIAANARISRGARRAVSAHRAHRLSRQRKRGAGRPVHRPGAASGRSAFGLAQPIFQGGRLFAEIDAVEARERQAVAQYQKTLQEAFREVRQALNTQVKAREVFEAESARTVALTEALRLARIRYQNGLLSQLEVIDAERNLLQAELNRSDALRVQRAAVADLVKALGGGWQGLDSARTVAQTEPIVGSSCSWQLPVSSHCKLSTANCRLPSSPSSRRPGRAGRRRLRKRKPAYRPRHSGHCTLVANTDSCFSRAVLLHDGHSTVVDDRTSFSKPLVAFPAYVFIYRHHNPLNS